MRKSRHPPAVGKDGVPAHMVCVQMRQNHMGDRLRPGPCRLQPGQHQGVQHVHPLRRPRLPIADTGVDHDDVASGMQHPKLDAEDQALHGGHVVMGCEPARVGGEDGRVFAREQEVRRMGWSGILEHAADAHGTQHAGLHAHWTGAGASPAGAARGAAVSSTGSVARTEGRAANSACQRARAGQPCRQSSAGKRKSR